ncbi:MAG: hypothetical protein QNJ84_10140 [Alphaproteobacteria bacterium]|nr:hypothetical protein [Alphaproteobacteria bacterium]
MSLSSFRSDLPLSSDESTRFLPWIVGFLTFVATLALAGLIVLSDLSRQWTGALETALTVELPAREREGDAALQDRVKAAIRVLKETPGVVSAAPVSDAELDALIEPWLGAQSSLPTLPFPKLIDVTLAPGASIDLDALNLRLAEAVGGRADDHGVWRARVTGFIAVLQWVALTVAGVVVGAAVAMIAFATRGSLAAHAPTVELLHLIGAKDGYIAGQFQKRVFILALLGAAPGALCATGLTVLVLRSGEMLRGDMAALTAAGPSAASPFLIGALIGLTAVAPAAIAAVSMIATRITVFARLRRMD